MKKTLLVLALFFTYSLEAADTRLKVTIFSAEVGRIDVWVNSDMATIETVKQAIEQNQRIAATIQQLVYEGIPLADDKPLNQIVPDGVSLYLALLLPEEYEIPSEAHTNEADASRSRGNPVVRFFKRLLKR